MMNNNESIANIVPVDKYILYMKNGISMILHICNDTYYSLNP